MGKVKENYKESAKSKKLISKSQQSFGTKKHNVFAQEVNKISLSANDDKRIQSIDSI